jgi:hypothetical protein
VIVIGAQAVYLHTAVLSADLLNALNGHYPPE